MHEETTEDVVLSYVDSEVSQALAEGVVDYIQNNFPEVTVAEVIIALAVVQQAFMESVEDEPQVAQ